MLTKGVPSPLVSLPGNIYPSHSCKAPMTRCYQQLVMDCKEELQILQRPTDVMKFTRVMLDTAPIISKVTDQEGSDSTRPVRVGERKMGRGVRWQRQYNDYQVLRGTLENVSLKRIILL